MKEANLATWEGIWNSAHLLGLDVAKVRYEAANLIDPLLFDQ